MSQFNGLFGATRIPQLTKDKIFRDPASKHVVVQKGGNFYVFDVLDSNGLYENINLLNLKVLTHRQDNTPPKMDVGT